MRKRNYNLIKNLVGQEFGDLKVIALSDTVGKYGGTDAVWTCRCVCGKEIECRTTELRNGIYRGCGCRRLEKLEAGLREHLESDQIDGTRKSALKAKLHVNNSSGVKGVQFMPQRGKWRAYIGFQGKQISLGYFDSFDDAVQARKAGEQKYHNPILDDEEHS